MSIPDGYSEPLFDVMPGYSEPYDYTKNLPLQDTNNDGDYERLQAFIQPATCLDLLLTQIKETVVMEISSDNIW